jgi:enamine deaminase RidA (YjgF/YER057c/UK114 family)
MSDVETRLAAVGVVLPPPGAPVANYVPFVRSGNLVHISGQVSRDAGGGITGVVGEAVEFETAKAAARLCGVNLISQMKEA